MGPDWMDELPWVLLGIRTAPSSAELVYGAPLTVPGDLIPAGRGPQDPPSSILLRLREKMGALAPIPTSRHGHTPGYVPSTLQTTQYVFIRRDSLCTPLRKLYEGLFRVLQHHPKAYVIDYGGRRETVLVDRLKPTHLDMDKQAGAGCATAPERTSTIGPHPAGVATSYRP